MSICSFFLIAKREDAIIADSIGIRFEVSKIDLLFISSELFFDSKKEKAKPNEDIWEIAAETKIILLKMTWTPIREHIIEQRILNMILQIDGLIMCLLLKHYTFW